MTRAAEKQITRLASPAQKVIERFRRKLPGKPR
jgi:hypothetical protein